MENQSYPFKEIYLFRHGHSQANADRYRKIPIPKLFIFFRKIFGFTFTAKLIKIIDLLKGHNRHYPIPDRDTPLESIGFEQAELSGKKLAEKNIIPDLILCSDYLRTRQTTNGIIAGIQAQLKRNLEIPILYSTLIVERDGGHEYGYPLSYFPVLFPKTNEMYHKSPKLDFRPPGGESIRDVRYNRIPALKNILASLKFKTLFIVGHGVTNSTIVSLLTGEDIENIRIGSPNLGVYRFTAEGSSEQWLLDPNFAKGKTIDPSIPFSG